MTHERKQWVYWWMLTIGYILGFIFIPYVMLIWFAFGFATLLFAIIAYWIMTRKDKSQLRNGTNDQK